MDFKIISEINKNESQFNLRAGFFITGQTAKNGKKTKVSPIPLKNKKMRQMYISESMDPLFRSFLQSGMARVIVTVRPGFEAAVQFFLETGLIWNGGEVPVIGDPLYLSIADEMRKPLGKPQGKYWITKLPTTLTILQDKSTGLAVPEGQALPVFPEANPANCENPSELETKSSFRLDDAHLDSALGTVSTLPKD